MKPNSGPTESVNAKLSIEPNGDFVMSDRNGRYAIDADLEMSIEEFIEIRDVEDIQSLQSILSRCQRIVKNAIARKSRQSVRDYIGGKD